MTRVPFLLPLALALAAPAVAQQSSAMKDKAVDFTVRIENVSTPMTLKLSTGATAPAPTAPVLWVVHTAPAPLFTSGQPDRGVGLETLAEEGNPEPLSQALVGTTGVVAVGAMAIPDGDMAAGPITPGKFYTVTFKAAPGQRLTLAMMFGQSNDLFYAPDAPGIPLFDAQGKPLAGDITSRLVLWDAGTEVNQEPGVGADQAPRQKMANTGKAEHGTVRPVNDGYTYPPVGQVVRVTVTPGMMGMNH